MADPLRDLDPTLAQIAERWDAQRTERTLVGLHRKRERVRMRRQLGALSAACALCLLAFVGWQLRPQPALRSTQQPAPAASPLASVRSPLHLSLSDGSEVLRRDERTQVSVLEDSAVRVALQLLAGQARFDVQRRDTRVFRVRSGDVTVEVLGTSFEVELQPPRTRVSVLRGRVAVSYRGGYAELSAGEAGWFPRPPAAREVLLDKARSKRALGRASEEQQPKQTANKGAATVSDDSWREPAEQGDFERAYELLSQSRKPIADDVEARGPARERRVEELLLAADTARLSGHPAAALPFLQRVVAHYSDDSRASLAAFTLGGVLMQQLGQPRDAEAAYARARELSLNSSLAEDALARQVEAAHRAGDAAHARALAAEYVARYPEGRRVRAVRRFGKLAP